MPRLWLVVTSCLLALHAAWALPRPGNLVFSADESAVIVADPGDNTLRWVSSRSGGEQRAVHLPRPSGLALRGDRVWVADERGGTVGLFDAGSGRGIKRWPVGPRPQGLALAPRHGLLLACTLEGLSLTGLHEGRPMGRLAVPGQPECVAVTPDESLALVVPLLPAGDATREDNGIVLQLVELPAGQAATPIALPAGATAARSVCISPGGKWAYVAHLVGRYNLPPTQLDRGWVSTNAVSIIDLSERRLYATVLLDEPTRGAADPWGMALSADGQRLSVVLSGIGAVAQVELAKLHPLLAGQLPADWAAARLSSEYQITSRNFWLDIAAKPERRLELVNDLAALTQAGAISRIELGEVGWRTIAIAPSGRTALANAFTGALKLGENDARGPVSYLKGALATSRRPEPLELRGERLFHDGRQSFQGWLSCASCHPNSRADGLNWDLLNDGMGNPKATKSLVWSARTPPAMAHGVRATMEAAAEAGFKYILFRQPSPTDLAAVQAYLRSLTPEPSPYLASGKLSAEARAGKAVFERPSVGCVKCHAAPLYTSLQSYDVGTASELDSDPRFDTPTLAELWRTAPYLHDGSAVTLRDVVTTRNRGDRHGHTSALGQQEIDALVAYLRSL